MKLFLKRPADTQQLVQSVLSLATQESDNPDLRDRGYIYWRLLSTDPAAAKVRGRMREGGEGEREGKERGREEGGEGEREGGVWGRREGGRRVGKERGREEGGEGEKEGGREEGEREGGRRFLLL